MKLSPLHGDYRAASSLPTAAFRLVQVPNDTPPAFYQLAREAQPLTPLVFHLLMGITL